MKTFTKTIIGFLLISAASVLCQPISWVKTPSLTKMNDTLWKIDFELNKYTDVEVSIVNLSDSTIIRHLAAGVLGTNPPLPFMANSLFQTLYWNGKADYGKTHNVPSSNLAVRVRAGMTVKLNKMVGNDPYTFRIPDSYVNWWYHRGMLSDTNGYVYMYGSATNSGGLTVRCFDKNGNYVRTVFPFPANLPSGDVSGYGINYLNGGKFAPKNGASRSVFQLTPSIVGGVPFHHTYPGGDGIPAMVSIEDNSKLCFIGAFNKWETIDKDGKKGGTPVQYPFITQPTLPASPGTNMQDRYFITLSPDKQSYYVSGIWEKKSGIPVDTGFWRDGQVYKVNRTTGIASSFIKFDTISTNTTVRNSVIGSGESSIHGLACDDSGHLFIADRLHGRIGVYDTAGVYIDGISIKNADQVYIKPNSTIVYVVTRQKIGWYTGQIKLFKFNTWRNPSSPVCSVLVSTDVDAAASVAYLSYASDGKGEDRIWVSHLSMRDCARIYKDEGASFTLIKGLSANSKNFMCAFDRLSVNRNGDDVYVNDASANLGKITDWTNPALVRCSTSAKKPLSVIDVAVSHDGQLYVMDKGDLGGPIRRYTMDKYHAPLNWSNTDSNIIVGATSRWGAHAGFGGMAIAPNKKLATLANMTGGGYCGIVADSGRAPAKNVNGYYIPSDVEDTLVYKLSTMTIGSPKFDMDGNFYIGASTRSKDHVRTQGFENDNAYRNSVGSIFKFAAGTRAGIIQTRGGCCSLDTLPELNSRGYEKIYLTGLAPFSSYEYCNCRTPRFDVDNYKRLIVPNAITQKVAVVDNNGNEIVNFGEYGNYDSQGEGSLVPTPAIPLCWPTGAVASDNFIYITDFGNNRLVRVEMKYELENIKLPYIAAEDGSKKGSFTLSSSPDPFNPVSSITASIPSDGFTKLMVYSADGRLIRTIAAANLKAGTHKFMWNGKDNQGSSVATGVYVYILTVNNKKAVRKTVLSR
ncbi:MAG: hypothetical protein JNL74_16450 [Fibrobacteres bacterium]|nr:hypothetical protein [Fibrobacterota bacterium]